MIRTLLEPAPHNAASISRAHFCFGVGLLGVARFQIDRLSKALSAADPVPPEST